MFDVLRTLIQWLFTALYAVVIVVTWIFVIPVVRLREWSAVRRSNAHPHQTEPRFTPPISVVLVLAASLVSLAGCTVTLDQAGQTVKSSVSRSRDVLDRSIEFAHGAPPAPYDPTGDQQELTEFAQGNGLLLTGSELAHIAGAAARTATDPALVATIVEQELRWLDDNELERDVLSALAGEDSSVGPAQVRVSTAEELEQEDPADTLPPFESGDEARTDRIRRLANSDWSILYASSYVNLLGLRNPYDGQLDLAQRYVGASPSAPKQGDQAELFALFGQIF